MEDPITAGQQVPGEQGVSNQEDAIKVLTDRITSLEETLTALRDDLEKEKNSNIRLTRDNDALRAALTGPRNTPTPEKSLFDDIM